jgi:hypothetical protein
VTIGTVHDMCFLGEDFLKLPFKFDLFDFVSCGEISIAFFNKKCFVFCGIIRKSGYLKKYIKIFISSKNFLIF